MRLSYADSDNNGFINASTEIIEESNYYPFGLKHKGYNNVTTSNGNSTAQKFKYNGIELNETLDLYEMDVRMYNPAIGRFNGIDPVTHHSIGTSVAFDNNPIFFVDPSGADAYSASSGGAEWNGNFGPSNNPYMNGTDKTNSSNDELNNSSCTTCPSNAKVGDTYNHSEFGKLTYGEQGWADVNGNNILDDVILRLDSRERAELRRVALEMLKEQEFANELRKMGMEVSFTNSRLEALKTPLTFIMPSARVTSTANIMNSEVSVYRVYGGRARINGRSYTIFNPQKIPFYRNFAGLPSANHGTDLIKGTVKIRDMKLGKLFATPIFRDKVTGGLPLEFYVKFKNVQNIKQIPVKNPF